MTRAPSSARTVQWAPPCVLRLEERLGWGHPAEGCGVPGPRCRGLCREHAQQAGPCRAPARGVAAVPVLGAGVAGGPGSAGPEEGCPLRSEAAAGLPICVGRGQSLPMSGPGRLPSLPAARAARGGRDELELIRPSLYRNVARQLNVSPHSETAVTSAFLAVAAQIFSAGVTWGKVVSLYSVAAGLAVDCVRQAQPAVVPALVDCLGEFVHKTLASWLRRRGGWTDILTCVASTDPGFRAHWLVAALGSVGRFLKAAVSMLLPER
ncbi:bcl-2-related ovarian killer protein isoform X6 [Pteropus medius]|uniref:bcl-2-related ovarian killer protein isoform X6 n=1 Tax=Pteropus vampyrus TaxID=132908 RepID=UPI00196ADB12|nr:bcl-2-related ovarian killer protein isoform X6 [Pteropus giganteus]